MDARLATRREEGRKNVNQTHSDPNGGEFHGDESHDLQSAKQHQHKQIQVYSTSRAARGGAGSFKR